MKNRIKRVTIALPENLYDQASKAARSERRSFSKQMQVAIERDLGLIPVQAPKMLKAA